MTREEAINILHGIQADNLNLDNLYTKDKYDALTMAIKALEQEPYEDCISRQAVLEPYKYLKDDDVISVWLIKKNIEQQKSVAPTSDTKQTIKCQDCKYRRKVWHEDKRMKNKGYWLYSCENNIYMGGDDEFCSQAERE